MSTRRSFIRISKSISRPLCASSSNLSSSPYSGHAFDLSIEIQFVWKFGSSLRHHRPIEGPRLSAIHRLTCLRCNCAQGRIRNALCAFQSIVRKITGFAAPILLENLVAVIDNCPTLVPKVTAEYSTVIIVVSEVQLVTSGPSVLRCIQSAVHDVA